MTLEKYQKRKGSKVTYFSAFFHWCGATVIVEDVTAKDEGKAKEIITRALREAANECESSNV